MSKAGIILWNRQKRRRRRRRRRRPRLLEGQLPFNCYGRAWRTLALFPTEQRLRLTEHPLDSFSLFKNHAFLCTPCGSENPPFRKRGSDERVLFGERTAVEEIFNWTSWTQQGAFPEESFTALSYLTTLGLNSVLEFKLEKRTHFYKFVKMNL